MSRFKPTHVIELRHHEDSGVALGILVQLVDGAAYTAAEWRADARADWTRADDGGWHFQGRGCPAPYSHVTVTPLSELRHGWIADRSAAGFAEPTAVTRRDDGAWLGHGIAIFEVPLGKRIYAVREHALHASYRDYKCNHGAGRGERGPAVLTARGVK